MSYRPRAPARVGGIISASLFVLVGLPYIFLFMMGERPCATGTCGRPTSELVFLFVALIAAAFAFAFLINFFVDGLRRSLGRKDDP